jgi:hypothetical protein
VPAAPARHRVADQHALAGVFADPARLVAERRGVGPEQRVAAAPRLHVGPAGGDGLDPDDDLAGRRDRVVDVDHAQVLEPEQHRRPHGTTTAFSALPSC